MPGRLALGAFTSPDKILDIAAALVGKSSALTPIVADTTLPTATLVAPESVVTLGTRESGVAALGSVVVQFSEAMQATNANTPGSVTNPRSFRFYHYGPDRVDNRGTGDDVLFPISSVNYNSNTFLATLNIDPASLVDSARSAGSIYKVLVLGASQTHGLRDLAGNLLDGGQDVAAIVSVNREPQLELPQNVVAQEGSLVTFNALLTHYSLGGGYTATIQWGDGTSSKIGGDDAFPVERFLGSHSYVNDGRYAVTVHVMDSSNTTIATQSVALIVENVAPVLATLPSLSANEGAPVSFEYLATDVGLTDNLTALVRWGDGTESTVLPTLVAGQFRFRSLHTYPDNGVFTVRVELSDGWK